MLLLRVTGVGGIYDLSMMCDILGCTAQVCLLAAVLCGSPAIVCPFPMSTAVGLLLWVVRALELYHTIAEVLFPCTEGSYTIAEVSFPCTQDAIQ